MKNKLIGFVIGALLAIALPAAAYLSSGYIGTHDHSSTAQGGGTLSPAALTLSGTGARLKGDFSNATETSRALIQSSVTDGVTTVGIMPNGTNPSSKINLYNTSDPANAGFLQFEIYSNSANIGTASNGTGARPTSLSINLDVGVTGTLSSTKACAAGFTRESPNFCRIINETAMTWTAGSTCTGQSTGSLLPAAAQSVLLYVILDTYSINAIGGPRDFGVVFYNETACTNINGRARLATWEYVATAASSLIARTTVTLNVRLTASNTIRTADSGSAAGRVFQGVVLGYFD